MSRRLLIGAAAMLLVSGCGSNGLDSSKTPARRVSGPAHTASPTQASPDPTAQSAGSGETDAASARDTYAQLVRQQFAARQAAAATASRTTPPSRSETSSATAPPSVASPLPARTDTNLANFDLPDRKSSSTAVDWIEKKDPRVTFGPPQEPAGPPAAPVIRPPAANLVTVGPPQSATQTIVDARTTDQAITAAGASQITSDQLEAQLSRTLKSDPKDVAAHLDYELLQMVRGRRVPQMETIAGLSPEDHETVCALLDAISRFRDTLRSDAGALQSSKVRPLVEMAERLQAQASLHIPRIALCSHVAGFGSYEPLPSDRFIAGQENMVIVYCEVENFSSRLNTDGRWQTDLGLEVLIYNELSERKWTDKRLVVPDLSRNRRHDFFVVRKLRLPASLAPGKYYLIANISDQQSKRVTEERLPFQIVEK